MVVTNIIVVILSSAIVIAVCHSYTFAAIVDNGVVINAVDVLVFEAVINVIVVIVVVVVVVSVVLVDYGVFVVDIGVGFVVLCLLECDCCYF